MIAIHAVMVAQVWQDAANRGDLDVLLERSDPAIEVVGPRGTAHGHQALADWVKRAGLTLSTHQIFASGDAVVMSQHAVWRAPETGQVSSEAELATYFEIKDGRVARLERFDSLEDALRAAGVTELDIAEASGDL